MIKIADFIEEFEMTFPDQRETSPWDFTKNISAILETLLISLGSDFAIHNGIAVHRSAVVEQGAVLKAPVILCENVFVGAHAYLRGGVFAGPGSVVGPACEIKASCIFSGTTVAHFNFIGDSILGSEVNFEAGALTANHFNEREDKCIFVNYQGNSLKTGTEKFGALVGDGCKIGANAVLFPGTILAPSSIVKRLELIDQVKR